MAEDERPKIGTPEYEEYVAWLRDYFGPPPDHGKAARKYDQSLVRQAKIAYSKGWTDAEVAELLGVCLTTIKVWRAKYPEFAEVSKLGKDESDERVVMSLYQRALGYNIKSEKVGFDKDGNVLRAETEEHIPADVKAAFIWLKNRRGWEWADRREFTGANGAPLHPAAGQPRSTIEIARKILYHLQRGADEGGGLIPQLIEEKVTIHE
jgi:hypothetical protein